ncbi:nicotinamide phosphoribosyltransferase [Pelomonas aquatica]|uniref:Nicotinamide phosphoribosyltransferase n=1 Tax=Pelomonas aquatica TaxID=431058 RepID=A0ABU1ZBQ7_9BURK|nr:nicotinate phosphoribosyltransferase [Pelomonas aquatica]MDR7297111.1 nicotinamide phosphoribosyltransferase [Pelomonas aquatica]
MALHAFSDITRLLVLNTDSYKTSHWLQYPPGTTTVFSYIEARGGSTPYTVFFGLQALLKEYFTEPVTDDDVALGAEVCAAHGVPFNREGWLHIVRAHGGRLPLRIRAVPEGMVVPVNHALVTVENTDPACWWLTSYVETALLRLWYPTTVATHSHATRRLIAESLARTGSLEGLPFKLHDFGARGVSSLESAMLGGMAHLVSFQGTDTMTALLGARLYYGEPMAGFSIPAAEHSTITAWGRDGELDAYRNMLRQFGKPGALLAVVSDSYDLDAAVSQLWGDALREEVIASGATVVIRPDSGDPTTVVARTVRALDAAFGSDVNAKGYKVLRHVRVIQGDGITRESIASILAALESASYSADNIAFGQGGALLQQVNRDTLGFAMKASAAEVDGQWRDVFKAPVTDPAKRSKAGRLTLMRSGTAFATVRLDSPGYQQALADGATEVLRTVYENGRLLVDDSFAAIRARAVAFEPAR